MPISAPAEYATKIGKVRFASPDRVVLKVG